MMLGFARGMTIFRTICPSEAPSILAASSISVGMVSK